MFLISLFCLPCALITDSGLAKCWLSDVNGGQGPGLLFSMLSFGISRTIFLVNDGTQGGLLVLVEVVASEMLFFPISFILNISRLFCILFETLFLTVFDDLFFLGSAIIDTDKLCNDFLFAGINVCIGVLLINCFEDNTFCLFSLGASIMDSDKLCNRKDFLFVVSGCSEIICIGVLLTNCTDDTTAPLDFGDKGHCCSSLFSLFFSLKSFGALCCLHFNVNVLLLEKNFIGDAGQGPEIIDISRFSKPTSFFSGIGSISF